MPRCRYCSSLYKPARAMQPGRVCNDQECQAKFAIEAIDKQRKKRQSAERVAAKEDRKVIRQKLDDMRTRPQLIKALGVAFRAWVRARDEGKECISCDTILEKRGRVGGDYDAGHFRSVGSAKHLEFDERNVHGQCKYCNDRLKGNPIEYRKKLSARIGLHEVEELESDQGDRKYSKQQLREMISYYRSKLKELKNAATS